MKTKFRRAHFSQIGFDFFAEKSYNKNNESKIRMDFHKYTKIRKGILL